MRRITVADSTATSALGRGSTNALAETTAFIKTDELTNQMLKVLASSHHHPEQVVELSRDVMAFEDLRDLPYRGVEHLEIGVAVEPKTHADEAGDVKTQLLLVDDGGVAPDEPFLLESSHSSVGGGGRKPDAFGQTHVRYPRVRLEYREDLGIDGIDPGRQ